MLQNFRSFIGNPTGITIFTPEQYGFSGIAPITLEVFLSCVLWGIIFTYTAVKGIKAIEKLAKPVAPTILAIALVMGFVMIKEAGGGQAFLAQANKLGGLGLGTGVTALVGSWIAGAVMGVDLFRFNKNRHHFSSAGTYVISMEDSNRNYSVINVP